MQENKPTQETAALWNTYVLSIPAFLIGYLLLRSRCNGAVCEDFSPHFRPIAEFIYAWGIYVYIGAMVLIRAIAWRESRPARNPKPQ